MKEKLSGFFNKLIVLELGSVLACPAVGVFFAELGARVIKIENTKTHGDVTRSWKLPIEDNDNDISGYFSSVNWGKESLALDISHPEGLVLLQQLVLKSDIILVNYKPGDASKLGTDYTSLAKLNPRLIYGHITGYGLDNPRAGYDAIIQGESGFTFMNGEIDGPPTKLPVALMDLLAAHQLKEGILLALLRRDQTGQGEYVDVSLMQAGIASLANQAANWQWSGVIPKRMGSDHPNIVPYGTIFSTADAKEIILAVGSDKQFERLCSLLGHSELATDERFHTNPARVKHREEIKAFLRQLIAQHTRDELLTQLEREQIPAGAINNMSEVFKTEQAKSLVLRGTWPDGQVVEGVRHAAFHFHKQAVLRDHLSPPPHYGEHSRFILEEFLGVHPDEIRRYIENKLIHDHYFPPPKNTF